MESTNNENAPVGTTESPQTPIDIIEPLQAVRPTRKSLIPMAVEPRDLLTIIHELNGLNTIHKWEISALSAFLYLTGARITEALLVRCHDLYPIEGGYRVTLRTLKARIYNVRQIPIAPIKSDAPFFRIVEEYLKSNLKGPDDFLFTFQSRFIVNNLMKRVQTKPVLKLDHIHKRWVEEPMRLHPHYFRHCRASHLPVIFNFGELDLMKFMGWSSTRPCVFYLKLNYKDMLRKMVQADVISDYMKMLLDVRK